MIHQHVRTAIYVCVLILYLRTYIVQVDQINFILFYSILYKIMEVAGPVETDSYL